MNPFEALGEAMEMAGTWLIRSLARIVCWVRGHRWITVFDRVELDDFAYALPPGLLWAGRVVEKHRECLRCGLGTNGDA